MPATEPKSQEEKVRQLAYAIWESEGCPQGHALDHWLEAERSVESILARPGVSRKEAAATGVPALGGPVPKLPTRRPTARSGTSKKAPARKKPKG